MSTQVTCGGSQFSIPHTVLMPGQIIVVLWSTAEWFIGSHGTVKDIDYKTQILNADFEQQDWTIVKIPFDQIQLLTQNNILDIMVGE